LQDIVEKIKKDGFTLNILVLGRVGLGKSSHIIAVIKMMRDLFGFVAGR
jgi:hypothetical protein